MAQSKCLVIYGALSAIAQETARCFAQTGYQIILVGRNSVRLSELAKDLEVRGASKVDIIDVDLAVVGEHPRLFVTQDKISSKIDVALIAYGVLGNQSTAEFDAAEIAHNINVNFTSVTSILCYLAPKMIAAKHGTIAVITSVAADRGRGSNFVYCSAKAGISTFVDGLRNRLFKDQVRVLNIKPGFVSTPMTSHLKQGPLFAQPRQVGTAIFNAILAGKDVLYTPRFWRLIMLIIRIIPEKIFKRLNL